MTEFKRFSEGDADDPASALFRSMREDGPRPGRKAEVLAAALAATATVSLVATSAAAAAAPSVAAGAKAAVSAGVSAASASAASTGVATALVPTVSIVKMIGAFVLGGAVTATALVATTHVLDRAPSTALPGSSATSVGPVSSAPVAVRGGVVPAPAASLAEPTEAVALSPAPSAIAVASPSVRPARAERPSDPSDVSPLSPPPLTSPQPPVEPSLPPAASAVVAAPSLADEVAALDGARRALASSDGAGALRALDAFQGTFPRARLGTEALVLRVEALVLAGRPADARALGEPFVAAHPDSPFAPRVRRAIGQKTNVLTIP